MLNRNYILTLLLISSLSIGYSQNKKLQYGGNVSLDIGKRNDRVEINPTVSRKIASKIYLGVGLNYFYSRNQTASYIYNETTKTEKKLSLKEISHYFGSSAFLRFYAFIKKKSVLKNLYLHTEFELLNGRTKYKDINGNYKYNNHSNNLISGIGFKWFLNKKLALNSNLLFKLNNSKDSPYRNPIFRLGFEF